MPFPFWLKVVLVVLVVYEVFFLTMMVIKFKRRNRSGKEE